MRKLVSYFGIGILLAGAAVLFYSCSKKYPDGLYAELVTGKGTIVLLLEYEKTPLTVVNFVGLAEGSLVNTVFPSGRPFYNGSRFHRVAPDHVIQGGAPIAEGSSGSGFTFPNEIHPDLSHDQAGVLGMANGGPHTNSSQFYITLGDRSYLDGDYTVFGRVFTGMEVVNSIVPDDVIESVNIVRVGKKALEFKADDATFSRLVEFVQQSVSQQNAAKIKKEAEFVRSNWPEAITTDTSLKYVVLNAGSGSKSQAGDMVRLHYTGRLVKEPEIFEYQVGSDQINRGFDEAIMDMLPGEKRVLIVPASLGYGVTGFYAREEPGEKRFVISPDSMLIYEVEILVSKL